MRCVGDFQEHGQSKPDVSCGGDYPEGRERANMTYRVEGTTPRAGERANMTYSVEGTTPEGRGKSKHDVSCGGNYPGGRGESKHHELKVSTWHSATMEIENPSILYKKTIVTQFFIVLRRHDSKVDSTHS